MYAVLCEAELELAHNENYSSTPSAAVFDTYTEAEDYVQLMRQPHPASTTGRARCYADHTILELFRPTGS